MFVKSLFLSILFFATNAKADDQSSATNTSDEQIQARANASAEQISDAEAFITELSSTMKLARRGEYGPIKRVQMVKLERNRELIVNLLSGHASATELPPEKRIELFNAQEVMTAIIRNDDKNRLVCLREVRLGSRLPTTECLTVGDREDRARAAQGEAADLLREICVPGENNRCTK